MSAAAELRLHARQSLALDEPGQVHLLESGALVLAAGGSVGPAGALPQRVLARLGPGAALISAAGQHGTRRRLLALAPGEAVLRSQPFDDWFAERARGASPVCRRIEAWIELLARLLPDDGAPGPLRRAAGAGELQLADGEVLCARRRSVVWVEVLEGSLRWMDEGRTLLVSGSAPLPLAAELWLCAQGSARVRILATHELSDAGAVLEGLARLGAFALERLDARDEQERQREHARLLRRTADSELEVDSALSGLAEVIAPGAEPPAPDDPLLGALAVVARSFGVPDRVAARPQARGGRSQGLEDLARDLGLRVRPTRLGGAWWRSDCGALIAWELDAQRRPVALLPRARGGYECFDPASNRAVRLDRARARRLDPAAFQVYRPLPRGPSSVARLARFALRGRARDFAVALAVGALATLLGMVAPLATQSLMDQVLPDADRRRLAELGLALGAAAFGVALFDLAAGWVHLRIGQRMEADTQAAVWDRLLALRPSFFRRFSSGDLQARAMAVDEAGRALGGQAVAGAFSALLALANLALLAHYGGTLAWLALALAGVVLLSSTGAGVWLARRFALQAELQGRLFGLLVQLLGGISKLRVAGAQKRAYAFWLRDYSSLLALTSRVQTVEDGLAVFGRSVPPLGFGLLLWLSFGRLQGTQDPPGGAAMSLGAFLAFHTAFATFLAAVHALGESCVDAVELVTRLSRVEPILAEESELDVGRVDPGRLSGRITILSVSFGYPGSATPALERVDLDIEPGELVAVVGPSGSGKSTLFRLLLGFETPTSGTVRYDGQDLATLDVHAVRRQIGVVLQGGTPEAESILENISGGAALTLDEVWSAAEDAGLAEDIRDMPMGLHTLVNAGGANLSGGQRQRLLIARALALRPRILLLDEATSALDNRTQEQISEALERLRITRLVIAHRLSTVRRADRIVVLERGRIVQTGTFAELARAPGRFAGLMRRQLA